MGLVYLWVCIQAGVDHDPVDEVVHYGGDAVDTTEPVVERGLVRAVSHLNPQQLNRLHNKGMQSESWPPRSPSKGEGYSRSSILSPRATVPSTRTAL